MISKPEFQVTRLGYLLTWHEEGVIVEVSRLNEGAHLSAECLFYSQGPARRGLLHVARILLTSSQNKAGCARALADRMPGVDWYAALEQLTFYVLQEHRHGSQVVRLAEVPAVPRRWLLYPYLEYEQPTVWYAYGGSGKSVLALGAAVSLAANRSLVGIPHGQEPVPVLYLDWETSAQVHRERLYAIAQASNLDPTALPLFYRRMTTPLSDAVESVIRDIEQHHIQAVIVDSMGMAGAGAPEESATVIAVANAIRQLGVATLCLHHRRKGGAKTSGDLDTLFGSTYYVNTARHVWEIDATAGQDNNDYIEVAFIHMKSNNTVRLKRHGFKISFFNDINDTCQAIVFDYIGDIAGHTELAVHASLADRILAELRQGARSVTEIADKLEMQDNTTRAILQRLFSEGRVVRLQRGVYGLASKVTEN